MTDKKKSIIVSVMFLAYGIFMFVISQSLKPMMQNDVGSGFFPKVISVVFIAMSLIRLIFAIREKEGEAPKADSDMKGGWETILLIGAYCMAFQPVGFIISTVVYLFLQILVLTPPERKNLPLAVIISVVGTIAIYVLFVYAINTPLPKGLFGF